MGKTAFGKKVKKNLLYIFAAILLLFVAVAFAVYAIGKIHTPVTTELALIYEEEAAVTINGILFRDESVITYENDGYLDYLVDDGERVGLNGTVANVYAGENEVLAEREIRELKEHLKNLESIASSGDVYVLGVDTIVKQITEGLCAIADCDGRAGFLSISEEVENLNDSITKKQVTTGGTVDFTQKISEIEEKIKTLEESVGKNPESIKAKQSGYFYRNCDGYENAVDMKTVANMTVSEYEAIKPKEVEANAIGKISDAYYWYYVFKADSETARNFKEGSTLYARFTLEKFKVVVASVNFEGDNALIVLRGDYAFKDIPRTAPLEVVLDTYEGIRVDDRAIRIVDGVTGVYVQMGYEVKFRKIAIAYQTEEFAIVPVSTKDGELKLYDSIIVKGEDLYDGKLLA